MSDESQANLSKRERQKQRRQARKEAERAAEKRARTTRIAVFALLGLAVLAGAGFLVQQNLAARSERAARVEEGQQVASEFGCTDVEEPQDLGAGHFSGPELGDNPPETVYSHRPTTSGRHIGNWAQTGVYDSYVDERVTTHNLEHGYVVLWYAEDAPDEQVEALKSFAQERIDDGDREIIVSPYNAEMDEGASFGFTAWGKRQLCEEFDDRVAFAFVRQFHNHSDAPETNVGPHLDDGIDPENEQAVFPPLGQSAGDGATSGEGDAAGEGDPAGEDPAGQEGQAGEDAAGEEPAS